MVDLLQGEAMCFSAGVSYGSAAVLIATGTATTLGNNSKEQRMIAAMPFFFGIQQAAEGIVWQTMGYEAVSSLHQFGIVLFLSFAFIIWPSWLPWSLYPIEIHKKRKKILKALGFLGIGVSILATTALFYVEPRASVAGHSVAYTFHGMDRHWPANLEALLYFTPTVIPFFVSSLRTVRLAGLLVFGSMLLAKVINRETETSVWCFFAALISFYIAVNVLWLRKGQLR